MGRPKGKSPARGGRQPKSQRRLDEYAQPRRSARLRSVDLKIETNKIGEPAELLLDHQDPQTITLQGSSCGEKAKSKKGNKQDEVPKEEVVLDKQGLKLEVDEQRELLKNFDLNHVYGPCRGITRRQRFERAKRYNLKPLPEEIIGQILDGHKDDFTFQNCIWDQNELLKLHV